MSARPPNIKEVSLLVRFLILWSRYLAEPPQLHFNLPITPRALTFIQETSCKLFTNGKIKNAKMFEK
jgi:hypothetical protein